MDDEEGEADQHAAGDDESEEEEMKREDLKDLMETLSLSQRAKNKRKRAFDDDDNDDFEEDRDDKRSFRSKYRSEFGRLKRTSYSNHRVFQPVVVVSIEHWLVHRTFRNNAPDDQEKLTKRKYVQISSSSSTFPSPSARHWW